MSGARAIAVLGAAALLAAGPAAQPAGAEPYAGAAGPGQGVADGGRAWRNYALNCQGCHRPDGSGDGETAPALAGHIGVFTRLAGGRAYLGRVPGVATAPLSDADLAELLNWTLWTFDPGHIASWFKPYGAAEIGALRASPLRTEVFEVRAAILAKRVDPAPGPAR